MARHVPPFECEIEALAPKGQGLGRHPDGRPVLVRGAVPGSRVAVQVFGRKDGSLLARRTATVVPAPGAVAPRCAVYGTCGGCTLQELSLEDQRRHKQALALEEIGAALGPDVVVHPVRGAPTAYGYRNKVELTFGARRWLTDAEVGTVEADGAFLGFHAPGRFDRVVDAERCELVSEAANEVLGLVRAALRASGIRPWDPKACAGFWRHLLVREHQGELLVVLFTGSDEHPEVVERLADALAPKVAGFRWYVNRGVADVARGELLRAWGRDHLVELLGDRSFEVSTTSFFQTNTEATRILYATVAELCRASGGTLLDLYCGSGTIGQTLADRFDRVTGVEENREAMEDARRNAIANGVAMELVAAKVEHVLEGLLPVADPGSTTVVVDPPRAGLHKSVAAALARYPARELVYVACNPASLGRDAPILAAGGWRATDLHTVDLFPQTGHIEVVARFTRENP